MKKAVRIQKVDEYYFSKKLQEIAQLNRVESGIKVINLGIGNPDLSPPLPVLSKLALTCQEKGVHGYQSYRGIDALRDAFSNYYKDVYGVSVNAETEIVPLMGSKEGIMHISLAFLNKGDNVLVPEVGYPTYTSASNLCEANIITYKMDALDWMPNIEYLHSLTPSIVSKIKLMWINYPNMPTGVYPDHNKLEELIFWCRKNEILLVNDNPYSNVGYRNKFSIFQLDGTKEVCIELNSLSKSHNMSGFRVGVMIGNNAFINTVMKVKTNFDSGMYLPIQEAAITALETELAWYEKNAKKYIQRKIIADNIITALGCEKSKYQGGIFLWSKINPKQDNAKLFVDKILSKTKVFLTPGFIFGEKGNNYLRLSLCSSIEILNEAYNRISKEVW